MRKKIVVGLLVFCLLVLVSGFALAQRELDDYFYQYEQYQKVYEEFRVERNKFLKHKILSARESAIAAVKKLLLQRNQTIRTYFLSLKYKLRTTPGVINSQSGNSLQSLLDKEITWLEEQSEEIENLSNPSLEDLFVISDRIEAKNKTFENLGYQALGEVVLGKIRTLQQESVATTALVKDEVSQNQSATQAATLNLWIKEVEVKNYLARKEIEAAEINLWNIRSAGQASAKSHFNNLRIDAEDTKLYLKQAVSYQKEILQDLEND